MNRDGSPETELEEFLFEAGIAHLYVTTGYAGEDLTKAQSAALQDVEFRPETNPIHKMVYDRLVYSERAGGEHE